MIYAITATVVKKDGKYTTTFQVPTFYLDSETQGIVDGDHAARIAESVINPTKDNRIIVNAYAHNMPQTLMLKQAEQVCSNHSVWGAKEDR